jgi:hypothetical protein
VPLHYETQPSPNGMSDSIEALSLRERAASSVTAALGEGR